MNRLLTPSMFRVGLFPKVFTPYYFMIQVARFKRQRASETKLQEIKERKERHVCLLRAAALSAPIETGEEDDLEDDGEEEREVSIPQLKLLCVHHMFILVLSFSIFKLE